MKGVQKIGACLLFIVMSHQAVSQGSPLFQSVPPSASKLAFRNVLKETPQSNVLTYEYFFNGGGVAIGDINNDGLDDIYFSSNMGSNKLYLNLGNMTFRDITDKAGVASKSGWKTGVSMVDVDGDGLLDIYVCLSGKGTSENRRNQLYINNGNLTFTERARDFGLDDPGYSTHATFFDYDNDGDLDMYLLNHNVVVIREFQYAKAKVSRDPYAGDKLFRNDSGKFTDVSESAGIKGNPLGFGLGVSVADINKDGWLDLYISNDYVEPDYLYINNGDGTFSDNLESYFQHISYFSMGSDVSDINNDGQPDIFTVDMLPEDNKRQKLLYGPENYEHYALMVLNGFYFQNMRNMLHLNNGNGTFSEIGQYAGISNTDWSWAPLFADFDNDGNKDLFVSNGYYRDYTNRDFLKYKGDYYFEKVRAKEKADTFHLVSTMTSTPLRNYVFRNNADLTFTDVSSPWGLTEKTFSSGAAYADLDNDGDLDLVVNNQNAPALLYRNTTRESSSGQNYLQLRFIREGKNTGALGTKVWVYQNDRLQYYDHHPIRGFQSSVTHRLHIGLGTSATIDSLIVRTLYGEQKKYFAIKANQLLTVDLSEKEFEAAGNVTPSKPLFSPVAPLLAYTHEEQGYNDFKRQPLLMTMLTTCGPVLAIGDINGDGLNDMFVGGAEGAPAKLFAQLMNGSFQPVATFDNIHTDADAAFFDADGDGDLDLYVVSGGYNEYNEKSKALEDRLYLNDGRGRFSFSGQRLPGGVSKSCIAIADYDKDGDPDIFVGGRVIPGKYPVTPESFLMRNNGGVFDKITDQVAPELSSVGMVTDAVWSDINGDGWEDLIVVGEFMGIEVFLNHEGERLARATKDHIAELMPGWWNKIVAFDFDNDGDQDFIVGNFGLNSQLRASEKEPVELYFKDFDRNGSIDPIMTHYIQGKSYPFASRDELLDQMYSMRSRYTSYASYSSAQLSGIFNAADLKDASRLVATHLESVYLENREGKLIARPLPREAQFAPVYAIELIDYNGDGNMDFILAGNQSSIRIRMGVIDANFGQLYQGDGKGGFSYVPQGVSGLNLVGDVKSLRMIEVGAEHFVLIGINNAAVQAYKLDQK
jgi:enediyne biosynthesis protein E4